MISSEQSFTARETGKLLDSMRLEEPYSEGYNPRQA